MFREADIPALDIRVVKNAGRRPGSDSDIGLNRVPGMPQHQVIHRTDCDQAPLSLCSSSSRRCPQGPHAPTVAERFNFCPSIFFVNQG